MGAKGGRKEVPGIGDPGTPDGISGAPIGIRTPNLLIRRKEIVADEFQVAVIAKLNFFSIMSIPLFPSADRCAKRLEGHFCVYPIGPHRVYVVARSRSGFWTSVPAGNSSFRLPYYPPTSAPARQDTTSIFHNLPKTPSKSLYNPLQAPYPYPNIYSKRTAVKESKYTPKYLLFE